MCRKKALFVDDCAALEVKADGVRGADTELRVVGDEDVNADVQKKREVFNNDYSVLHLRPSDDERRVDVSAHSGRGAANAD